MGENGFIALMGMLGAWIAAVIAAGYHLWQKHRDFSVARRSIAAALYAEITEAQSAVRALFVSWEDIQQFIRRDPQYRPLLVVSSDVHVLERVRVEDWHFSLRIVTEVIAFRNAIYELYECLRSLNSDAFASLDIDGKLRLVEMAKTLTDRVEERAENALKVMRRDLSRYDLAEAAAFLTNAGAVGATAVVRGS